MKCMNSDIFLKISFTFILLSKTFSFAKCQPEKLNFENFTIENGLSNNLVQVIHQDKKGWMWFGTYQGLNRFDGYKFTVFEKNVADSLSLGKALIRCIFEDKEGRLWVGTEKKGLYIFNRNLDKFRALLNADNRFNLQERSINAINEDLLGCLWIGTDTGLCQIDATGKILKIFRHAENNPHSITDNVIKTIQIDQFGKFWVGTSMGLDIVDPKTGQIINLNRSIPYLNDEISTIFINSDTKIWAGTYKNGIVIIDPLTFKIEHVIIDPSNERSNTIRTIVKDNDNFWIGTRGGLYIYNRKTNKFLHFKHDGRESGSLIHNSVLNIYKDAKGDFWIATRGGISYVVKEKQVFQCYKELPNDRHYMNNGETYAFWIDSSEKLWIGTETGGVNVFDRNNKTFSYIERDHSSNSLSSNCIKALMGDDKGNLWIGTFLGGINILNLTTRHISYYQNQPENSFSISSNKIWALLTDSRKNIWIGTERGLDKFDPKTNSFIHYNNVISNQAVIWINEDSKHDLWVGTNDNLIIYNPETQKIKRFKERTRMMFEDKSGRFWVTTIDKGLALFDKDKGIIKNYDQNKGIANNEAYCILEDNNGYLWISTINGLSRFDPAKETFRNFDKRDGLENDQFRYRACYKSPKGELIFGGLTGFNIFNPNDIKDNEYESPIVLTDFKIFNKHVQVGEDKKSVLQKSISETQTITLLYNQNSITLEFALLNYAKSAKNKFAYQLAGFEKDWNEADYNRTATYTNINPGEYTFFVKASNGDNIWNKNTLMLEIKILPPYWKTLWFKFLVLFTILTLAYLLFKFILNRNHLKHELIYERERAKKLHELDMMKVSFYTNVSHEIRTPLTLITAPLEKMLNTSIPVDEMRSYLTIMNHNAQKLLRLINQLLDFRKSETGNLKLELTRGDIVFYLKDIVYSFSQLAMEKNIKFEFESKQNDIFTLFDADKFEKIISNLLSNAIKFTPDGGYVKVSLSLEIEDNSIKDNVEPEKFIEIVVRDSGEGIPETDLNKIFNRFFQSENAKNQTGTGIGLALTKELVKLHNGKIFVESNIGRGTTFKVNLPFYSDMDKETLLKKNEIADNSVTADITQNEEFISSKILLVVEDNAELRYFIRTHFEPDIKVIEATNGKEGLNLAFKYLPDIIISDILMPVMDGKEFCKILKKDERTSHIPIIMLTALSAQINKLEGILAGAEDYITKPFDIILLKTKVENLLLMRNMLREKYSGEMILKPKDIVIENPEQKFLNKMIDIIEKNMSDCEFDVDKLSLEVGISRTQLYRKMSALTDMGVREFIRSIRLKRATQLLVEGKMAVSDVAIAVGFKDISHFRKSFRQEFGISATKYGRKHPE